MQKTLREQPLPLMLVVLLNILEKGLDMLEYTILTSENEKNRLKGEFLTFFLEVYGKPLDESAWFHQFINSPYNDTPLFIVRYNNKLVGSALMIKQKMDLGGEVVDYFLFTTSAILESYRNLGIYAEFLKMQKKYAMDQGASFIFAFPNKLAHPVLKLFGRFKDLKKIQLGNMSIKDIDFDIISNSFFLDENVVNWRFEHNDYRFLQYEDYVLIVKEFESALDLLAIYPKSEFESYSIHLDDLNENLVVFGDLSYAPKLENVDILNILNPTYFVTNKDFDEKYFLEKVSVNLLMSDVF